MTRVDFRALDNASIKPVGVYGSRERIVDLFLGVGSIETHLFVIPTASTGFWHVTYHAVARIHFLQVRMTLWRRTFGLASILFNPHHLRVNVLRFLSSTGPKKLPGTMMQYAL